jgi:peptidoglycan/xylan/chitin deacetylase (PgdA/CDA1 family)
MTSIKTIMFHSVEDNPIKCLDYLKTNTPVSVLKNIIESNSNITKWSLDELDRFLSGGFTDASTVLILTFDDGYKSFMSEVLPAVEKYNIPVAVFVTTDFASENLPYEIQLANLIENSNTLIFSDKEVQLSTDNRFSVYTEIKKLIKRKSPENRKFEIDKLLVINKPFSMGRTGNLFMSWNDLRSIASHPLVTIGSHCISHCVLKSQTQASIFNELSKSKKMLEDNLGVKIKYLSYPYGSHSNAICDLAYKIGYSLAFKAKSNRRLFDGSSNRYAIPRHSI